MKKINSLILYRLSNSQHQTFLQSIQELIDKFSADKLNITEVYQEFEEKLETLDLAIQGNRGSATTFELLEIDRSRLKIYSAIRARLKCTISSPYEEESVAAKLLHSSLMRKGEIPKEDYSGKNVEIHFLCENLLDEEHLPLCKELGIKHWIEALRDENNLFQQKQHDRQAEYAYRKAGKVSDARKQVDEAYLLIVSRINAFVELGMNTTKTDEFIKMVNIKIKQVKSLKAWRKSMREGKKRREEEKSKSQ